MVLTLGAGLCTTAPASAGPAPLGGRTSARVPISALARFTGNAMASAQDVPSEFGESQELQLSPELAGALRPSIGSDLSAFEPFAPPPPSRAHRVCSRE